MSKIKEAAEKMCNQFKEDGDTKKLVKNIMDYLCNNSAVRYYHTGTFGIALDEALTPKPSEHKYILIELEERNGEQEYRQHVRKKIAKDVKPEDVADYVARTWYEEGRNAEESDGGYLHLSGCVFVRVEGITEITEQEFNVLQKLSI